MNSVTYDRLAAVRIYRLWARGPWVVRDLRTGAEVIAVTRAKALSKLKRILDLLD